MVWYHTNHNTVENVCFDLVDRCKKGIWYGMVVWYAINQMIATAGSLKTEARRII